MVGTTSEKSITRRLDYDHAGRLLKTWHQVSGVAEVLLTSNEYNELGQLVDKKLHSSDNGTTFKQSTDYRYNIRGWLTSINNPTLSLGASNDDTNDLFGMNLGYENDLVAGNTPEFNGNISSMTWSTNLGLGSTKSLAYNYSYDTLNRIKAAAFKKFNGVTWSNLADALSESGYKYDLNGNIKALTRKDNIGGTLDALTYDYGAGTAVSNQLLGVSDGGNLQKGFIDGNIGSADYAYDANGSMTLDKNKSITAIIYNHLNLPTQVTKNSGDYIKYIYDAGGRKLSQQVYDVNNVLKKKTDYLGEYFYENDTLKFINHEEGRVVMTGTAPEY